MPSNYMQKVEKLKSICLHYAAAIQLLIPSIYVPEPDAAVGSLGLDRSKPRRSQSRNQQLNLAAESSKICDSIMYEPLLSRPCEESRWTILSFCYILWICFCFMWCRKFEKEFNAELQSLVPILSNSSQAEPYLTHLAQCILGVGSEQWVTWWLLHYFGTGKVTLFLTWNCE